MTASRLLLLPSFLLIASCASVHIDQVDFGWPVESVLTVGEENRIEDRRYAVSFDITPVAVAEFEDSTALRGREIRLLRSTQGYYYITGPRFLNVYVFSPGESSLKLHSKIAVIERRDEGETPGMRSPAMNQRPPHIELLDGSTLRLLLTADGIVPSEEKGN